MTTELAPYEGKQPVAMKGGLVHWVSEETAERIQQQLQTQTAHTFMRIRELSITINTAEVEGVYTMEQYADVCKVKQGMWQCQYRNWHNKGKRECECAKEAMRRHKEAMRAESEAESNRPPTQFEREEHIERMRAMKETGALQNPAGIFGRMFHKGNRGGNAIRRSTIDAWEKEHGTVKLDGLAIEEDVAAANRAEALEILE